MDLAQQRKLANISTALNRFQFSIHRAVHPWCRHVISHRHESDLFASSHLETVISVRF